MPLTRFSAATLVLLLLPAVSRADPDPKPASGGSLSLGGAGLVGLRWLSPIGPIRAGVALPLGQDKDRAYEPGFIFSLGGSF